MIPGRLLHRVARALCSATFCQRVAEPLLADFQHEWREAKGLWQRVSALASGYGAFWCTFVFHAGHVWRNEVLALTWRDAFPFPGAYVSLTSGIRMMLAFPAATFLLSVDVFRTLLRGWVPFAMALLVIMLVQPKERRAV